ncbi:MAG: VOC family protein [Phycicoccus sp.]
MTTSTPPQLWLTFRARDARALIRFLVDAFGFEEKAVYGEGDRVDHAELWWPAGGGVMLGSVRDAADGEPGVAQPGTASAYAVTDRPDDLLAQAVDHGATVVRETYDTDYGTREFSVRDPEGNSWSFGTYQGAGQASADSP